MSAFEELVLASHNIYGGKVLCPAHSEDTPSCHIYDDHAYCFGCGKSFDAIEWLRVVRGIGFAEARREAGARGLLQNAQIDFVAARHTTQQAQKAARKDAAKDTDTGKRDYAERIWREAKPITEGMLAHTYLASRAIPRAPDCARQHPGLYKREAGAKFPAIVYAITDRADETLLAVEVAWLMPDATREPTAPKKKTYGRHKGGSAKFGVCKSRVIVCEGAESAMSAAIIHSTPAEAVMGSQQIAHWQPPEAAWVVALCPDNDQGGDGKAQAAFGKRSRELHDEGYVVTGFGPNRGTSDFNDLLVRNPRLRLGIPDPITEDGSPSNDHIVPVARKRRKAHTDWASTKDDDLAAQRFDEQAEKWVWNGTDEPH